MADSVSGQEQEDATRPAGIQNTGFEPDPEEIRIVLIGKTGNGKSASANTILGRKIFRSVLSPCSVTSECEKATGVVNGCKVALIDTPGIFDTKYTEEEVIRKLKECISYSAPGPHVFLIVLRLGKFTEEEQDTIELLQQVFGEEAAGYSLVLFTGGEKLGHTAVEDYFSKSGKLSHFIEKCRWRYHVFSNKHGDSDQVTQLLVKIKCMMSDNGGKCYTNAMFQAAEQAIQERARKIMEASAAQKRREEEKLKKVLEGEQLEEKLQWLEEEYLKRSRAKAEKKNKFLETGMMVTAAEVGTAVGAAAGTVGGPLCIALGAVAGGLVGAVVGLLAPAAVKAIKNKCSVQ